MGFEQPLPSSWARASVGDVGTVVTGNTPSTQTPSNYGGRIPFVKPPQLNDLPIGATREYLSEQGAQSARVLPPFSILVSCIGNLGKTGINKTSVAFNQQINAIVPSVEISPAFLFYQVQSHDFRSQLEAKATATTISIVNKGNFETVKLNIAPLAEQHRIVAKIEELFSELDQGVASLKTARDQLKVYRQSLLKDAFAGKLTAAWRAAHRDQLETAAALQQRIDREREAHHRQQLSDWQAKGGPKPRAPKPLLPLTAEELAELPELPEGWFGGRLGMMTCGVEYGTAAKSAAQGVCPVLRMGNIQNGKFDWSNLVFTDDVDEIAKYRLSNGEVLFNRTNSPELVGKTAIFKGLRPALFAGYLIRVNQIQSIVLPEYLNYFLNSPIARQHGNMVKTDGVNQSNINGEKLINYPFPFCGIDEQFQIVQELESKLSEADQLDQTLATAAQQADALRQSILKKAFCGQLVKQDENDEPATVLLELICGARLSASGKKKTLSTAGARR